MTELLGQLEVLESMSTGAFEQFGLQQDLLGEIEQYRHLLVQDFVGPKAEIDQQYCELIVSQLANTSQTSEFRLSAFVLLFFLLSPVTAVVLNILMTA
jgi:hypothetical protein